MDDDRISIDDLDLPTLLRIASTALLDDATGRVIERGFADLRTAHGHVVQHVVDGPRRVGDIAARMGVTQQAVSKSLQELVRLGIVDLMVDPGDARARVASLTPRGRSAIEEARRARAEVEHDLRDRHGARRIATLRRVLVAELEARGLAAAIATRSIRA